MKKTNAIHAHLILSFVLLPVVSTAFIDGVTQEQILRLLNSVRSRVVPTASRMVQLQWNASLAASAARYASTQCNGGFRSNPTCAGCSNYIGDAEYPSYGSQGILDVIEGNFLVQRLQWQCKIVAGALACSCLHGPGACDNDWNVIVNDAATSVGCGEQAAAACLPQYSQDVYVCMFDDYTSNASPYTASPTNSSCTQGTCPSSYPVCVNGLCTTPAAVPNPARQTRRGQTRRPTTSSGRSTLATVPRHGRSTHYGAPNDALVLSTSWAGERPAPRSTPERTISGSRARSRAPSHISRRTASAPGPRARASVMRAPNAQSKPPQAVSTTGGSRARLASQPRFPTTKLAPVSAAASTAAGAYSSRFTIIVIVGCSLFMLCLLCIALRPKRQTRMAHAHRHVNNREQWPAPNYLKVTTLTTGDSMYDPRTLALPTLATGDTLK